MFNPYKLAKIPKTFLHHALHLKRSKLLVRVLVSNFQVWTRKGISKVHILLEMRIRVGIGISISLVLLEKQ